VRRSLDLIEGDSLFQSIIHGLESGDVRFLNA
jgi:hypothetical protein